MYGAFRKLPVRCWEGLSYEGGRRGRSHEGEVGKLNEKEDGPTNRKPKVCHRIETLNVESKHREERFPRVPVVKGR